jgi:spore germination cell wall hydrolase CwlJ-like protein
MKTNFIRRYDMLDVIAYTLISLIILLIGFIVGFQFGEMRATQIQAEVPTIIYNEIDNIEVENVEKEVMPVEEETYIRFPLSDYERSVVESLVMAEAGGECYEGQIAVAQCILNACERNNCQPSEAAIIYKYTKNRPKPSDSVKKAVDAVFNNGETVTESKILYFYAPDRTYSSWHESQNYIMTIGGHRFFALKGE